jgi:hypothetical protein
MKIIESGMTFGDYKESDVFHIEKSDVYSEMHDGGIKTVEFILRRKDAFVCD